MTVLDQFKIYVLYLLFKPYPEEGGGIFVSLQIWSAIADLFYQNHIFSLQTFFCFQTFSGLLYLKRSDTVWILHLRKDVEWIGWNIVFKTKATGRIWSLVQTTLWMWHNNPLPLKIYKESWFIIIDLWYNAFGLHSHYIENFRMFLYLI